MANGINKVILIGSLGADPEVRVTTQNDTIASFSLATNESWTDASGVKKEKVEWRRCVAYRRLGEIVGQYLSKGSKIYIEGRLKTRKWQGQDGIDRYTTEIIVKEMQILDSKPQGGQQPAQSNQQPFVPDDEFSEDIPF